MLELIAQKIETWGRVGAASFAVVGCWFLVPRYGMTGAAASLLIGLFVALIIYGNAAIRSGNVKEAY